MKLGDGVWTFSAFNCNSFGPSVLFDLLLRELKHVNKLKPEVDADCVTPNTCSGVGGKHILKRRYATLPSPYHRPAGDVRVLLIEVLLKLGQLVQVPLFLPQSVSGVAEFTTASAAVAPKARRSAAIPAIK